MRRTDTFLVVVVGGLALFVGAQAIQRPSRRAAVADQRTTAADAKGRSSTTPVAEPASSARPEASTDFVRSGDAVAPVPNREELRARLASANDSYMADMLAADSEIVRWPDRSERGLRVWVQSMSGVQNWDLRYAQMARDAFAEWSDDLPARLDFVLDSAGSDIRIVWVDRFPPQAGQRIGVTRRTNNKNGWLVAAEISIAVHDSAGETIPASDLSGTVRHEAGHALGLGHSKDPRTKMFPVEMTHDITPADRATLRLLYQLPPGSVR